MSWEEQIREYGRRHRLTQGDVEFMIGLLGRAVAEEREECACAAGGAMSDQGTDDPHEALRWAAQAIRARGASPA